MPAESERDVPSPIDLRPRTEERPGPGEPTELRLAGRRLRLKWHKLRRRAEDPPFSRENLRAGLAAGASLELDLRPLADGGLVCLHDPYLESETTGRGRVSRTEEAALAALRLREGGAPAMLLEELVEIVRSAPCAPEALVQLDLQRTRAELGGGVRERFAAALRGVAERFLLSGTDAARVAALGGGVPGLRLGYDPSHEGVADAEGLLRLVAERAPGADTVYLHREHVRESEARGEALVARLRERGHRVDCWTLDHGDEDAAADLEAAARAGCEQVTTNTPLAWREALGVGAEAQSGASGRGV